MVIIRVDVALVPLLGENTVVSSRSPLAGDPVTC
jgi:hypothetical protein